MPKEEPTRFSSGHTRQVDPEFPSEHREGGPHGKWAVEEQRWERWKLRSAGWGSWASKRGGMHWDEGPEQGGEGEAAEAGGEGSISGRSDSAGSRGGGCGLPSTCHSGPLATGSVWGEPAGMGSRMEKWKCRKGRDKGASRSCAGGRGVPQWAEDSPLCPGVKLQDPGGQATAPLPLVAGGLGLWKSPSGGFHLPSERGNGSCPKEPGGSQASARTGLHSESWQG